MKSECEDICQKMLQHLETINKSGRTQPGFVIGKTRAYFRWGCLAYLESERAKIWGQVEDPSTGSWVYCSSINYDRTFACTIPLLFVVGQEESGNCQDGLEANERILRFVRNPGGERL